MGSSRHHVTDVLSEPRVIVGLDFGTTFSGFAYAHVTKRDDIFTYYNYAMVGGEKPYCKTLTGSYYKEQGGAGSRNWVFKSWGYPARAEFERDFQAVRRHRINSKKNAAGVGLEDPIKPSLGHYITRVKLHLAPPKSGKLSATALPEGLKVEQVITDYLREMGKLILKTLQQNYGEQLTKQAIQWCVTVPSIWDNSAKQKMKSFMVAAGLVDGVDGSPHPLVIVLEPEAASFHCLKTMNETHLQAGDKLLVADIGGETVDIVVQEVISTGECYRVKEITKSSGALCGGTYVDARFVDFLHERIGPCLKECMKQNPSVYTNLIKRWEEMKLSFGDPSTKDESMDINLPNRLVSDWEKYDTEKGGPLRDNYDDLEVSYADMQRIFDPVIEQNLQLINEQLVRLKDNVKVMVVVGGFAGSQYLMDSIKKRFAGRVSHIISPPNPGSAVCQGAVALALDPNVIVSRIARKTYGFLCVRPFEEDNDKPEFKEWVDGVAKCNNRFSIYVRKGDPLDVDHCISKTHKPVYTGQRTMKFELFSSEDPNPRYTIGNRVEKEGEIIIDISGDTMLDKDRQVKLSLYFGRSILEVKAEAMNFMAGGKRMELPVEVF